MKPLNTYLLNFPPRRVERGDSAVEEAARIYRELKKSGKLIGMRDIMIGGITIANNLSFSTNNIKDFKRIKDLRLFTV